MLKSEQLSAKNAREHEEYFFSFANAQDQSPTRLKKMSDIFETGLVSQIYRTQIPTLEICKIKTNNLILKQKVRPDLTSWVSPHTANRFFKNKNLKTFVLSQRLPRNKIDYLTKSILFGRRVRCKNISQSCTGV